MKIKKFLSDKRGAVIIETAFALPVLILLMIGMLQFGLVLQASGAMRNAIGQGIRFAKVNPNATETEVLADFDRVAFTDPVIGYDQIQLGVEWLIEFEDGA